MKPLRIGLLNFEPVINQTKLPVLLVFGAVWDRNSNIYTDVLETISKKFDKKLITGYVDYDYAPDIFSKCKVGSIPTVIIFEDGVPVMEHSEYYGSEDIIKMLYKFYGAGPYEPGY